MSKKRPVPTPKLDDELDKFINNSNESKTTDSVKTETVIKSKTKKDDKKESPKVKNKEKETKESVEEEKKLGRPTIESKPLSKKLIISVTEDEWRQIEEERGLVAQSAYLRMKMRESGIIK